MNTSRVILGTAQLGMNYGINNLSGRPSREIAHQILSLAEKFSILHLDTAEGYGESQEVIGSYIKESNTDFKISTKFQLDGESVERKLEQSLRLLNVTELDSYFFHSFSDYKTSPEVINELLKLRKKKSFFKIGVSIYSNLELESVIEDENIDVIQLPFNMFDNELQRGNILNKAKEKGLEVHARSTFLQGLFFMNPEDLPEKLTPLKSALKKINSLSSRHEIEVQDMAILYPLSKTYIDKIVFGVETVDQLKLNIESLSHILPDELTHEIDTISPPPELINPMNW